MCSLAGAAVLLVVLLFVVVVSAYSFPGLFFCLSSASFLHLSFIHLHLSFISLFLSFPSWISFIPSLFLSVLSFTHLSGLDQQCLSAIFIVCPHCRLETLFHCHLFVFFFFFASFYPRALVAFKRISGHLWHLWISLDISGHRLGSGDNFGRFQTGPSSPLPVHPNIPLGTRVKHLIRAQSFQ